MAARVSSRPALRALAARAGVLSEYVDQTGVVRRASDATRVAILDAMGFVADTEVRARESLHAVAAADAAGVIAPARVVRPAAARMLPVRPPGRGEWRWEVEVTDEAGRIRRAEGRVGGAGVAPSVRLPFALVPGHYRVAVRLTAARGAEHAGEQALIVTPGRCLTAAELGLGRDAIRRGVFGIVANLYTLRSARNWGVGDLGDLCELVRFAGTHGAAFVGINPLHALGNVGDEISPYQPLSRLYRNPLYLDVTAVPELRACPAAHARLARSETRAAIAGLRDGDRVDYAAVMAEKDAVLRELHRTFLARHRGRGTARGEAYERYRDAEGESLRDFATFVALRAHFAAGDPRWRDWRRWPARYRDHRSRAVADFRIAHGDAVDYACFLQFELDRQLAMVAARARAAGLGIGVYQDLALGSSPLGCDPWAFPDLFLRGGVSIGAPPDPFAPEGQNWGLPPMHPLALARDGYRYWTSLVRGAFRHAGALRIDHVMGLFRQFWIPPGGSGADGAYVRMPADALLGILALESARARALVIGEDLGTVPAELPRALARWGLLSMRVLYFMREARGGFVPARRYGSRALVSANTHDMAPLAGYLEGSDLRLRRRAGQIPTDAALAAAERERAGEHGALIARLRRDRLLAAARAQPVPAVDLHAAVHGFLARTPGLMLGIALDDLTGEREPVNLPGVGLDTYPSWSRKMRGAVDTLATDAHVRRALGDVPKLRGATARRSRSRPRARSRAR